MPEPSLQGPRRGRGTRRRALGAARRRARRSPCRVPPPVRRRSSRSPALGAQAAAGAAAFHAARAAASLAATPTAVTAAAVILAAAAPAKAPAAAALAAVPGAAAAAARTACVLWTLPRQHDSSRSTGKRHPGSTPPPRNHTQRFDWGAVRERGVLGRASAVATLDSPRPVPMLLPGTSPRPLVRGLPPRLCPAALCDRFSPSGEWDEGGIGPSLVASFGVASNATGRIASGIAPGITLGGVLGGALGFALGIAIGVAPSVAPGIAPGVTPSVALGVALGAALGVALGDLQQERHTDLTHLPSRSCARTDVISNSLESSPPIA